MSFDPQARFQRGQLPTESTRNNQISNDWISVNTDFEPDRDHLEELHPNFTGMPNHKTIPSREAGIIRDAGSKSKFVGTIGMRSELGRADIPRITLVVCRPHNHLPYLAIRFVFLRKTDGGHTYLDANPSEQSVDFIFETGKFDLCYKKLSPLEKSKLHALVPGRLPDGPLLCVKFTIKAAFRTSGLLNGAIPTPGAASQMVDDMIMLKDGGVFEWITIWGDHWVKLFQRYGRMFAECGKVDGFRQYTIDGEPFGHCDAKFHVNRIVAKANNNPAMMNYPDHYLITTKFNSWNEFVIRYFWATVHEHTWINQWCDLIRDIPIPSRWVRKSHTEDTYLVSFNVPDVEVSGTNMLNVESQLFIHFERKCENEKKTGQDHGGWKAVVLPRDWVHHDGIKLIQVQRPRNEDPKNPRVIPASIDHFNANTPFVNIFLRVVETEVSVKARVIALEEWDPMTFINKGRLNPPPNHDPALPPPDLSEGIGQLSNSDGEFDIELDFPKTFGSDDLDDPIYGDGAEYVIAPGPDDDDDDIAIGTIIMNNLGYGAKPEKRDRNYLHLRELVMGHGHSDPSYSTTMDFSFGAPPEVLRDVFRKCTTRQVAKVKDIIKRVPDGVLVIMGPAGTGKTTMTLAFIDLAIRSKQKVLIVSTTNTATGNIFHRLVDKLDNPSQLHIRLHTTQLEIGQVRSFNPEFPWDAPINMGNSTKNFTFIGSLAHYVLQVLDFCPTTNQVIMSLKSRHARLREAILIIEKARSSGAKHTKDISDASTAYGPLIKACMVDLLTHANTVSATTIAAITPWLDWFREEFGLLVVDEAASVPLLETMRHLLPKVRSIHAGDEKQIQPYAGSKSMVYATTPKRKVNTFVEQIGQSFVHILAANGFPVLFLDEQLRMDRGINKIAAKIVYKDELKDWDRSGVSKFGQGFERFVLTQIEGDINPVKASPSPPGEVWPLFIDVKNSFSHKELLGTSRANTYTANISIECAYRLLRTVQGLTQSDIVIVTPYKYQVHLISKAVARHGLSNVCVSTVDGHQGMEATFVIFDTVCSISQIGADAPGKVRTFDFLGDPQRFCVGITRMQAGLIIIGDAAIFERMAINENWKRAFMMLFEDKRVVRMNAAYNQGRWIDNIGQRQYEDMVSQHQSEQTTRAEALRAQGNWN